MALPTNVGDQSKRRTPRPRRQVTGRRWSWCERRCSCECSCTTHRLSPPSGIFQERAPDRTEPPAGMRVMRRLKSWRTVAAVGFVAAVLLGLSLLEGDVPDDLTGFGSLVTGLLN